MTIAVDTVVHMATVMELCAAFFSMNPPTRASATSSTRRSGGSAPGSCRRVSRSPTSMQEGSLRSASSARGAPRRGQLRVAQERSNRRATRAAVVTREAAKPGHVRCPPGRACVTVVVAERARRFECRVITDPANRSGAAIRLAAINPSCGGGSPSRSHAVTALHGAAVAHSRQR